MAESGEEDASAGGKKPGTSRSSRALVSCVPTTSNAGGSRVNVSPMTPSAAVEEQIAKDEQDRIRKLEEAVRELLDLCARNEVNVPEDISKAIFLSMGGHPENSVPSSLAATTCHQDFLMDKALCRSTFKHLDFETQIHELQARIKPLLQDFEVHVKDGSYTIVNSLEVTAKSRHGGEPEGGDGSGHSGSGGAPGRAKQKIETVVSANPLYKLYRLIKKCVMYKGRIPIIREERKIMEKVNLVFESGKMYLVLGAPGSGKSTLLKYIANMQVTDRKHYVGGELKLGSVTPGKGKYWSNIVAYIDQIDRLDAYLTVYETCEFAWRCRSGGTHRKIYASRDEDAGIAIRMMDEQMYMVNTVIENLGLSRVKDTFVGDQVNVRGVSGGEKKRVTCAEMFCVGCPVLCCDEISTGLDAATTYDITHLMSFVTKTITSVRIVSLLQPPPETVANFDEIVLLSEGKVIFAGPIDRIIPYFEGLGYEIPTRMDLADFLQSLPTKDGWMFLKGATRSGASKVEFMSRHLDTDAFHEEFYSSELGLAILEKLNGTPQGSGDHFFDDLVKIKYANPWYTSMALLVKRELTLWWRDKYQLKTKVFQSKQSLLRARSSYVTITSILTCDPIVAIFMGVVVGTVFFQSADVPNNVFSILFQSVFYQCLSAMVLVVRAFQARPILYKQQDALFFPSWAYVVGRSLSTIPVALIDAVGYGSFIFWLSGLAYSDGASIANYFMFLLLLFITSLSAGLVFGVLAAVVSVVSMAQASLAFVVVILVLFSGFTVQPDVIPVYYSWLYWLNFVAWMLRALVVNQFDSGKYSGPSQVPGLTEGEAILVQFGFVDASGQPFTFVWAWYGILFTLGTALSAMWVTSLLYSRMRFATGKSLVTDKGSDEIEELNNDDIVEMPFRRVDLTFKDIHYTVKSSISREKLALLKGVDGVVLAGEMTALMGSSGAGKTTLMDVLAMRKNTGEITGQVRLNGHPQEEKSFRRCAGYVEQFDVQAAELTIKETVLFSAKLRLDETNPAVNKASIDTFVNQTMNMLELTNQQDLQVGSDDTGGLSFEQRKRLSIAVELVANPSILFLDEPTSGLDARAATIVMRGLRRIASTGRAVCATIHQPSVNIFNNFDSLLLLKHGGEVVFFGPLGRETKNLIQYLESFEATPRIQAGENPATWMLTTIGAGSATDSNKKPFDYAGSYSASKLRGQCLAIIESITASASDENLVSFASMYATSMRTQCIAVARRAMTVYYRSPSYNLVRVVLASILALLYATVYVSQRVPRNESDMNSRINSIFMAVLFLVVSAQNTVLGVFEAQRNMYYRHKAANMYTSFSVILAFTLAEIPFILLASLLFSVLFYFLIGLSLNAAKFFLFFMFVAFGIGTFALIGQMLMSLFKDAQTAQGIGALVSSSTSLFAGVFIRPDQIPTFWIFMYWLLPGHWLFEGIFMSQFENDDTMIAASPGSAFYNALNCTETSTSAHGTCEGTVWFWVQVNFTDWSPSNIPWDAVYLIGAMIVTRCVSLYALTNLNYMSN